MEALEPEFLQIDFLLQVRKGDLSLLSQMQLDSLMKTMVTVQNRIINKGYSARVKVTIDGVMM